MMCLHILVIVLTFSAVLLKKFAITPHICMHKCPYMRQLFFTGLCSCQCTKLIECNVN